MKLKFFLYKLPGNVTFIFRLYLNKEPQIIWVIFQYVFSFCYFIFLTYFLWTSEIIHCFTINILDMHVGAAIQMAIELLPIEPKLTQLWVEWARIHIVGYAPKSLDKVNFRPTFHHPGSPYIHWHTPWHSHTKLPPITLKFWEVLFIHNSAAINCSAVKQQLSVKTWQDKLY